MAAARPGRQQSVSDRGGQGAAGKCAASGMPYGTKYKDLELPDKLSMRVWTEDALNGEDGVEDEDGAEKIATPSELQSEDDEAETEKTSQTLSSSETDGTVRKASPSEADVTEKSEIGGGG